MLSVLWPTIAIAVERGTPARSRFRTPTYPAETTDPATTREAWRPDLPPGYTWDAKLVAGFEDTAPGGQSLMHVAADALRSSSRWPDVGAALDSLASRYGDQEAEALLEDAVAYAKAHVPEDALANLKRRGVLYAPDLIRTAALFWRQRNPR